MSNARKLADGIKSSADATAITIDSSERVGINETTPDQLLHVNGGAANVIAKFESTDPFSAIMFTDDTGSAELGGNGNDVVLMPAGTERFRSLNDGRFKSGEVSYAQATATIHTTETRYYKLINYASGYMFDGVVQIQCNRNGGFNQTAAYRNYNAAIGGYSNALYGPFNGTGDTGEGGNGVIHLGNDEAIYLKTSPSIYGGQATCVLIGRIRSWDYDGTYVTSAP